MSIFELLKNSIGQIRHISLTITLISSLLSSIALITTLIVYRKHISLFWRIPLFWLLVSAVLEREVHEDE
jgi:heme/copper-type cytochrome/quinol oxidase subunit 1